MKREDLEHIIRAAAGITDERIFVVVGSQAILGQYPAAPPELLQSIEADLYPLQRPDLADLIEGSIGIETPFHQSFGYYAEGVGPETAKLPAGWEKRSLHITNSNTTGATAICPEAHDLAASKLVAGREKDIEWVRIAVERGLVQKGLLAERVKATPVDKAVIDLALRRIAVMGKKRDNP